RRLGPSDATLKLACVGAWRTAETADSPPARIHVTALTRRTEIPDSRAASGLLAAARICLPSSEERMKGAGAATRTGRRAEASTHLAARRAESVPSWAWARLRNRFDL